MTEPYRVLFVHHVGILSGAETSLLEVVRHLDRQRVTPFCALPPTGPLCETLRQSGVTCTPIPLTRLRRTPAFGEFTVGAARVLSAALRLALTARSIRASAIHANSDTAMLAASVAARLLGLPLVWHRRDLVNLGRAGEWMAKAATRIVAISDCVAASIPPRFAHKAVRIRNGIDTATFCPGPAPLDVRAALSVPADATLVTMAAQLVPWKKHALFISAARQVADRHPSARFLIVGDDRFNENPAYRAQLVRDVENRGLADRVRFTGFRQDMPALLRASDVLVHPADREPFGRVIAEAMASGKPVVAVRACGPAEIVRDGEDGFLVGPDDAEAMAAAVVALADDPVRARQMGAHGRSRVVTSFNIEGTVAALHELYEHLGSPSAGVPP